MMVQPSGIANDNKDQQTPSYDDIVAKVQKLAKELQSAYTDLESVDFRRAVKERSLEGLVNDGRDLGEFAYRLWTKRQERLQIFPGDIFGEPGWDMLLFLYAQGTAGKETIIKSVASASGVPVTTALRWIGLLEEYGLVERGKDMSDRRRQCIVLTDAGFSKMTKAMLIALGLPSELAEK